MRTAASMTLDGMAHRVGLKVNISLIDRLVASAYLSRSIDSWSRDDRVYSIKQQSGHPCCRYLFVADDASESVAALSGLPGRP